MNKLLLSYLLLLCGCTQLCIDTCRQALRDGIDLSNGPCLNQEIAPNRACDVAHSPRLPIDDEILNQCPLFGVRTHHFVEVDSNCNLIRVQ